MGAPVWKGPLISQSGFCGFEKLVAGPPVRNSAMKGVSLADEKSPFCPVNRWAVLSWYIRSTGAKSASASQRDGCDAMNEDDGDQ